MWCNVGILQFTESLVEVSGQLYAVVCNAEESPVGACCIGRLGGSHTQLDVLVMRKILEYFCLVVD